MLLSSQSKSTPTMTMFSIAAAARAVGTSRTSIQRAIKSGRLSATTNDLGERVIDLAELLRVFGPLKGTSQDRPGEQATVQHGEQHADMHGGQLGTSIKLVSMHTLVDVLKKQLDDARDRERDARERERALMDERDRLLLETEQQTRCELETKLLSAPKPTKTGKVQVWILLAMLVAVLVFAGWHFSALIVSALTS
jgi:hypothetical protein